MFDKINGFNVRSDEFVVIEDIAVSRYALSVRRGVLTEREYTIYLHPEVNNSQLFTGLNYMGNGLSNRIIPYPQNGNDVLISPFNIPPGKRFDVKIITDTPLKKVEYIYVYIRFTAYDSTDAVLANQLNEIGKRVTPESVDWIRDEQSKQ